MMSVEVPVAGVEGEEEVYVVDTSVIIEGVVSKMVKEGKIRGRVIVHKVTISELENQANQGKVIGFLGLKEISRLRELASEGLIKFEIVGERPKPHDIKYAHAGAIDAIIRDLAWELNAILVVSDRVQAEVAKALGIRVLYIKPKPKTKLKIEEYFDDKTMSVHLKEGTPPVAKKGKPGEWYFVELSSKPITR
ncbi:MAG TPA: ATPase, partial [Desulfurococcales archaeon]|nr:ATPase [Desulfurococcales archaeon]